MSLEISSWTFSFQKTAFIDSNLIKLWLLEKNKINFCSAPQDFGFVGVSFLRALSSSGG